jgi:lysozyme family protein
LVQTHPQSSEEQVREAEQAIDELNLAKLNEVLGNYEERTAILNNLVQTLHRITAGIKTDPTQVVKDKLKQVAQKGRDLLLEVAKEAISGNGPEDTDVIEPDDDATAEPAPEKTKDFEKEDPDQAPPPRQNLPAKIPSPILGKASLRVPQGLQEDYERLFASCAIRPDKLAKVNWHVEQLLANQGQYEPAGTRLGIPWWFIGIIHAMETGFRFDRHLHNGDPLSAKTKRVPAGRPETGTPPFPWEASALDALVYMKLDDWDDWSVAGCLYKWERYNGFGYREHHPEVLSPYLWSYTSHYTKGKYVSDGEFDGEAISRQCGTAAMLRAMINKSYVVL